jgi:hypothetical protein
LSSANSQTRFVLGEAVGITSAFSHGDIEAREELVVVVTPACHDRRVAVMDDVQRVRVELPAVCASERGLAGLVDVLDSADVLLDDASALWKAFDRIERLAANAKTLLAARVEEAGTWRRVGARSAAEHLAKLGGTTTIEARRSLETSKRVAGLLGITDALRGGVLSRSSR